MLIFLLFQVVIAAHSDICAKQTDILPVELNVGNFSYSGSDQASKEMVVFQFFYETGDPLSKTFYINEVAPIAIELFENLYTLTYPFGNGKITRNDVQLTIECQHGEPECYGNMLHACSTWHQSTFIQENFYAFTACMMNYDQSAISNDVAADACGKLLNIDPEPIKKCANSPRGFELLLRYGIASSIINYPGVPWWLINGVPRDLNSDIPLKKLICAAFKSPPEACNSI